MYPIFLRPEKVKYLIIGAGNVATEKLHFLLKNSPEANIHVVGLEVLDEVRTLCNNAPNVHLEQRGYEAADIENADIVIAATNHRPTNISIRMTAKQLGKLINVADDPKLCDFYLGGVVTKGQLKVAISTNGKSPTFAKRFRQLLEESLDEASLNELLDNLNIYRKKLSTDFQSKVDSLNELTHSLID